MKQPARSREHGQRLSRDEPASASGFARMAEVSALASAAGAMAIGIVSAKEQMARDAHHAGPGMQASGSAGDPAPAQAERADKAPIDAADPAVQSDLVALPEAAWPEAAWPEAALQSRHASPSPDGLLDPSALATRIAEQIASSVSHVLDVAAGGAGTPQTLSRVIVEQAQHIARDVHDQFAADEPLAVLADLVPPTLPLDTLATGGVMDLLQGVNTIVDPGKIVDGIVADLHGLHAPIDMASAIAAAPLENVKALPEAILGGAAHGANPLADLFYDDGGAEPAHSAIDSLGSAVSDAAGALPKIGFLAQPLDIGETLGGLTHGHNVLQLL